MTKRRPDPSIAPVAALLADPARAAMLWALADGRMLPAGELAQAARVTASTASHHLARLLDGDLITAERQGRHRYFRLAGPEVAAALEALAVVHQPRVVAAPGDGAPRDGLRFARSCYDHLAGYAGVMLTDALVGGAALAGSGDATAAPALIRTGRVYRLTPEGVGLFHRLGVDGAAVMEGGRVAGRHPARACLDWSERRYHLAGALGRAMLDRVLVLGWFERKRGTRALGLTNLGRRAVQREFGVRLL